MPIWLIVVLLMFAGGVLTSIAEYHFKYSLWGSLLGLFTTAKTDLSKVKTDLKKVI